MNILFCPSDNNKESGAFLCMVDLASILKRKYGCNVYVVLTMNGNGKELLDKECIEYFFVRSFNWTIPLRKKRSLYTAIKMIAKMFLNLFVIGKYVRLIKEYRIDIVHVNTSWTYVGAAAAIRLKKKLVWHIREFLEEDQKHCFFYKKYAIKLFSSSSKLIAVSDSIRNKYAAIVGKEKIIRIYDGVDAGKFYNSNHRLFTNAIVQMLIVGRINEGKGQLELLKSCIELIKRGFMNFTLKIVGTGTDEYIKDLKTFIDKNNLKKNVCICGYSPNPSLYYSKADITFVCSRFEAFGRVTVEAMLNGSLVIGSDTAGTKELIQDGFTGYLYKQGDPLDLADKIQEAVKDTERTIKMAECGQRYMMENMTAERNAELVFAEYYNVLNTTKSDI